MDVRKKNGFFFFFFFFFFFSKTVFGQQADSIIVSFFSADSPTGMFKQLPTDVPAQQALLSSVDRQLPAEAQQACEGPDEGIPLAELHSALKASARGKKPGSDGLPYEFYTQFWDLLGPALLAVSFFFFFFFLVRSSFFFFFFFYLSVTGEMSIPFRQAAVKDARRT
ncbi:hypothetical protein ABBQ32_012584 [Trebouxia sp. C0010 RCD-2024]